jgi:hypothetical protein
MHCVVDLVARFLEEIKRMIRTRIDKVPFTTKASRPWAVEEEFPRSVRLVTPHSNRPTPDETRCPTLSDGIAIVAVELRNAKKHVGRRSMSRRRKESHPAGYRGPRRIELSLTACLQAGGL